MGGKNIETPEKLKEYFLAYEKEVKSSPFLVKDWVGKDAEQVYREKEKPLTMAGFECWLSDNSILERWKVFRLCHYLYVRAEENQSRSDSRRYVGNV